MIWLKVNYAFKKQLFIIGLLTLSFIAIQPAEAYHAGMNADAVVGQADFTTTLKDGVNTEIGFENATISTDGTRLFVSDCNGNRVLIYNTLPTSSTQQADVVIGQTSLSNTHINQSGALAANTLRCPTNTQVVGTKLLVGDAGNSRLLIFNQIPTTNNANADIVVGQPDMTTFNFGTTATYSRSINMFHYDETTDKLVITDTFSNRVLIYNGLPEANGAAPSVVVGQSSFTASSNNQGTTVNANTLYNPSSARIIEGKLFIVDKRNSRVLIFNTIPAANNASASIVIGQANMTTGAIGLPRSSQTLYWPGDVLYDGDKLLIQDTGNSRVLVYDDIPTANHAAATAVIGQPSLTDYLAGTSEQKLNVPAGLLASTGSMLLIGDTGNQRILGFPSHSTNETATFLLGQPSYSRKMPFAGYNDGANVDFPQGVATDGTRLFVADTNNNRVLIYTSMPTSNHEAADVVIGQPDMASTLANQGSVSNRNANTLSGPTGIYTDGEKLFVVDSDNGRLLIYNEIPTTNNASADVVVGQPNMTTVAWSGTVAATSYSWVNGVYYDTESGKLVVTDGGASRVLIYNELPTSNGAAADVVVGQTNFTSENSCEWGAPTASCLYFNYGTAMIADGRLVVPDNVSDRVLIWNSVPTSNGAPANVVLGQDTFSTQFFETYSNSSVVRPNGAAYDGKRFYVSDGDACRILVYNQIPTINNQPADYIIGEQNHTGTFCKAANSSNFKSQRYGTPIAVSGHYLTVADTLNNRVMIFKNPLPTSSPFTVSSTATDHTPIFNWDFSDNDSGDAQAKYQLQLDKTDTFNSSNLRDTGIVDSSDTSHTVTSDLSFGYWFARLRLTDSQGDTGNWTETLRFAVGVPPSITVTNVNGENYSSGMNRYVTSNLRPTFSGTASPGAEVAVKIHSDPIVLTTTADSAGNWSVTPSFDLPTGEHMVYISATLHGLTTELGAFGLSIQPSLADTGENMKIFTVTAFGFTLIGAAVLARRKLIQV